MKSPRSPTVRRQQNTRLDRHSGTGQRGLPKKNGAGGKTVWGSALDQAPVAWLDKNDPNYDPDDLVPPLDLAPVDLPAPPPPPPATESSESSEPSHRDTSSEQRAPTEADQSPSTSQDA